MTDKELSSHRNVDHSCNRCPVDFSCGKVMTALTLLDSMVSRGQLDHDSERTFQKIKAELEAGGWAYPSGISFCDLAFDNKRVHVLIDDLIKLLNHQQVTTKKIG